MNINYKKLFWAAWLFSIISFSVLPILSQSAYAQNVAPANKTAADRCTEFQQQFIIGPKGSQTNIAEGHPFFCSASDVIIFAINYLLVFSGSVTVLFLIIGGFWYLTSAGNEEQAEKGKKTLINSVIGLVIIMLSFAIVKIVAGTLGLGK